MSSKEAAAKDKDNNQQSPLPNQDLQVVENPLDEEEKKSSLKDVIFDCNFECGNMEAVYTVQKHVYEVWVRNDSNGSDLMWFNFRIKNQNNFTGKVKIRIVNIFREKNLLQCVSTFVYEEYL